MSEYARGETIFTLEVKWYADGAFEDIKSMKLFVGTLVQSRCIMTLEVQTDVKVEIVI